MSPSSPLRMKTSHLRGRELAGEAQLPEKLLENHPAPCQFVEDDPLLPRGMLIGDSISARYTPMACQRPAGVANVHRPLGNCTSTRLSLEHVGGWLCEVAWSVIHFNWGLHDVAYTDDYGIRVDPGKGAHQVPIDQYERNLGLRVARMAAACAKLIWATTTPIPEGAAYRLPCDEVAYNAVAELIMHQCGIPIYDLHADILPHPDMAQLPANVHFAEEGYALLGERAAPRSASWKLWFARFC